MAEFKIPPISTLAGSTFTGYFRILWSGRVAPRAYHKVLLTALVVLVRLPFSLWESWMFADKLRRFRFKEPPLFILGHWRSGTTLLHNTLAKDPTTGFVTTFQSLFPNNLASAAIFKTFMRRNMPERRPADNVALNIDFPQEDEFAFGNMQPDAYYNFFYFPSLYRSYYERAVHHKGLSPSDRTRWYRVYDTLLKKAAIASGRDRLIVKNPVNTARISHLLHLYPDARFLYIHREPISTLHSTKRFFEQIIPMLCLEEPPSDEFLDDMILDVYDRLHRDYDDQKHLIPEGNLMEIDYADFEAAPMDSLEQVYAQLLRRDIAEARPPIMAYLETQKGHEKNKRTMDGALLTKARSRLAAYLEQRDRRSDMMPGMTEHSTY
jgi:omega-hydroxy-beta-dihydromenaquinone-9 sulfotransferase